MGGRLAVGSPHVQETHQRLLKDGIRYTGHVPITGDVKSVKVIVYDYRADLIGSAVVKIN